MNKPGPEEYVPFYATYISKVGNGDIIKILEEQMESTYQLAKNMPADKAGYAYAPGKWTIKEVWGHMADTERVMAYRALRFARNDSLELQGFDQDDYMTYSRFNERSLDDLAEEFKTLRQANMYLLKNLNAEEKQRGGLANGNYVTVNALLYIIAGHEHHHIQIVKERYL
ncbi:DinB family protein [Mucilaginibacter sp. HMF5004]|uniref:DinB family protein n=1 Tax=Mucilaginibacter rivuli TaxID=2857527 RepID=UPI001C5EA7DE|nr:DinB family protein [Mucilaginibacter rivuli]MBW4890210.1 DinB family protein [Mucilaginibacter rivuli]